MNLKEYFKNLVVNNLLSYVRPMLRVSVCFSLWLKKTENKLVKKSWSKKSITKKNENVKWRWFTESTLIMNQIKTLPNNVHLG